MTNQVNAGGETMATAVVEQRNRPRLLWRGMSRPQRLRLSGYGAYLGLLTLVFIQPLAGLFSLAAQNSLHSHIPLVPLIAGYLLYIKPTTHMAPGRTAIGGALILAGAALGALVCGLGFRTRLSVNDYLAVMAVAYVCLVAAGGFLFLGNRWMAAAMFPMTFLIFIVPLPDAAVFGLENVLVAASADAAALFFKMTGTPLLREGTVLALPGIVLEVSQECSGIRSSWVLFITSVLAANLLLESRWRRIVLVLFVIPLAVVRNGFRILVIGLLCVHVGPHMIDSVIHRRGGPLFFLASLVPLFLLLAWLRRQERRRRGGLSA